MHTSLNTAGRPLLPLRPAAGWLVWWRLLRPHTLTASFVPVLIGTALAMLPPARFNLPRCAAMLLASMLIQTATNLFNEYFDYVRGLDNSQSVGIGGAIVRYGVAPRTIMALALVCLGLALPLGLWLCAYTSWWLLPLGGVCTLVGYLYSGGPYPLSATPLGELLSGVFMGLIIILIAFFLQTGTITWHSVLLAVPTTILIGTILMANNIRDLDGDRAHGRHTLAILLGRERAIRWLAGMFAAAYLWLLGLALAGQASPWTLLALASALRAWWAWRHFPGRTAPEQLMPAMQATAQTNTLFGLFLTIGLVLQHWF